MSDDIEPNELQPYLDEFIENGYVVIPNVYTEDEIQLYRERFHESLEKHLGISHEKVISGLDKKIVGGRLNSPVSNIFYGKWKLDITMNEEIYNIFKYITINTFGKCEKTGNYHHPFKSFDDVVPYIDHVCYRLPDNILKEGGLGLHLDRNPHDPYLFKSTGLKRWRPIQGFITMTDHFTSQSGGLRVVKDFHKDDEYFSKCDIKDIEMTGGEFCRMNGNVHKKVYDRLEPVIASAGSLVLWDNRLPHATSDDLIGFDTREVAYISYIPKTDINIKYLKDQSKCIKKNIPPPQYERCEYVVDKDWIEDDLSEFQKEKLYL